MTILDLHCYSLALKYYDLESFQQFALSFSKIFIFNLQQITNPRQVRGTLLHLTKFYRRLPSETHNLVLQVTERILASPVKMCLFSDAKDLFSASKTKKFTKSEVFRRYIKVGVCYEQ